MKLKKIAALIAVSGFAAPVFATNGMNMEGYGPVATAMGGASFAYDNGTAGLINNPATLGFIQSGTSRLDVAIGGLHPDVTTKMSGMPDANSGGDAYYMPAVGYVRKDGKFGYGIGVMAQGGMGTEYGSNTFLSGNPAIPSAMGSMVPTTAAERYGNRSELGIGRVMFPLTYDVSDTFKVGGTVDYLWGGLDLQMVMSGAMFARMTGFGGAPATRLGYASGGMISRMGSLGLSDVNYAQFDFSEGTNKMKQRLTTNGWAGNIGFVWQATPKLSIGGVYHAKTDLSDMEGDGKINMSVEMPGMGTQRMSVSGKLKVIDFQWPETFGLGMAYQASDKLMLVADYKRIGWSDSMKNFKMSFVASGNPGMLAGMNGADLNAVLRQNWDDQDVLMIGGSYKVNEALTLRAGLNLADNPIPDKYMNPLFPAIIKNTLTVGFGYEFSKVSSIDFSLTHAPSASAKNNNDGMGTITTDHAQQNNWQLMYSHRF